jgi:hypothetical protein
MPSLHNGPVLPTLIAADNTGRVCRGVERNPRYIDVIIRRYEAAMRKTAVLADTGETFATLAAQRQNNEGNPFL